MTRSKGSRLSGQVRAERLDLGQHAVRCRPVQQAGEHGVRAVMLRRQRRERVRLAAEEVVPAELLTA